MNYRRSNFVDFVVYLDDGLGVANIYLESCDKNASFVCETLSCASVFSILERRLLNVLSL